MGMDLLAQFPESKSVFDRVSTAVGRDIAALCRDADDDTLRLTENAQIALYTCGLAAWEALKSVVNAQPAVFAGHSVGEYAAVAAAGAFSIETGAILIKRRGELMAQAKEGAMSAILGLDREALEGVCRSVEGVVVIANDNCPGQLVISGSPDAVAAAGAKAVEEGAKRALPLNVSGAFHSPLMHDAAVQMREALNKAELLIQHTPVAANVHAGLVTGSADWPSLLAQQLESSVLWAGCVGTMLGHGVTLFVECGGGEVLTGLLRRIDKEAKGLSAGDSVTLLSAAEAINGMGN